MKDYTNNKKEYVEKTIKRCFSSKISQLKQSFNNRKGQVNQLKLETDLCSLVILAFHQRFRLISSGLRWLNHDEAEVFDF